MHQSLKSGEYESVSCPGIEGGAVQVVVQRPIWVICRHYPEVCAAVESNLRGKCASRSGSVQNSYSTSTPGISPYQV